MGLNKSRNALVVDAGDYEKLLGRQTERDRLSDGTFAPKSSQIREVKSLRVTDETWDAMGKLARAQGITRADLIEQWVMERQQLEVGEGSSTRGGATQGAGQASTLASYCTQGQTELKSVPCAIAPQSPGQSIVDENQEFKQQVALLIEQVATIQVALTQAQEQLAQIEFAKKKAIDPLNRIYEEWFGGEEKKKRSPNPKSN